MVTDANSGLQDKLPVTVKVINSGEDNEPGKVRILNRQPEIGIELVADLTDPDTAKNVKWQWYRAVDGINRGCFPRARSCMCESGSLRRRHPSALPVFP